MLKNHRFRTKPDPGQIILSKGKFLNPEIPPDSNSTIPELEMLEIMTVNSMQRPFLLAGELASPVAEV